MPHQSKWIRITIVMRLSAATPCRCLFEGKYQANLTDTFYVYAQDDDDDFGNDDDED